VVEKTRQEETAKKVVEFASATVAASITASVLLYYLWRQTEQHKPTLREKITLYPRLLYWFITDTIEKLKERILGWLRDKICEC
jgi:hypothetical protein